MAVNVNVNLPHKMIGKFQNIDCCKHILIDYDIVSMSSHNLTSIAISREVSKIGKMHQSYNDVVRTLITEHWERVSNTKVDGEEFSKTNLTNPNLNSIGVALSQYG